MTEAGNRLASRAAATLPFAPSVDVVPEEHTAATPYGLVGGCEGAADDDVAKPEGLAEADVRDSTITLPAGVELSPSAANGLVGCSEGAGRV